MFFLFFDQIVPDLNHNFAKLRRFYLEKFFFFFFAQLLVFRQHQTRENFRLEEKFCGKTSFLIYYTNTAEKTELK